WPRLYAAAERSWPRRKILSTRPGVSFLKTLIVSTISANPTASPMSGARIMNTPILMRPAATSEPKPAFHTAAPTKAPISAWDDDVGKPQYHVIRSHTIAPARPARMTHWSTTAAATTPLPTVVATCTPKPNAATKLKKAAHTTACSGVSTRVETTV